MCIVGGWTAMSPPTKGFCLRLVLYIAEDDAWVIGVKPAQILPAFEMDVGPR